MTQIRTLGKSETRLMLARKWQLLFTGLLFITTLLLHNAAAVDAQQLGCTVSASEVELNSGFNLLTVLCYLPKLGPLQIQMLDRGNELDMNALSVGASVPTLDPHNEVWIFNYQTDKEPSLVIDFHQQNKAVVADLYDRRGSNSDLTYQFSQDGIAFTRTQTPTVEVIAPDGWWYNGKLYNFNLDMTADGRVESLFDTARWFDYFDIKKDGSVDFEIHVRDSNNDGIPDDDWRTANILPRPGTTILPVTNTNLVVNTNNSETALKPALPWAYLNTVTYAYLTSSRAATGQPPIQVDWENGLVDYIGEFVSSRANENQWFVYSFNRLETGELNQPNFESQFAWYDLADDHDGQAELAIRFTYDPPLDKYFLSGRYPKSLSAVRYSWDQDNDGYWDYKLALVSNTKPTDTVSLPELNLKLLMPSYNNLPGWVIGQSWDIATFVASEGRKITGEGIYEWDFPDYTVSNYFPEYRDAPLPLLPDGSYDLSALKYNPKASPPGTIIDSGERGEYAFKFNRLPQTYISGIDGELHLSHAEDSYWNVDDGASVVRGSDLDGDGYQDIWQYFRSDTLAQELVHSSYALIYNDTENVIIDLTSIPTHLFESSPPATHGQWLTLGNVLKQYNNLHLTPGQFSQRLALSPGLTLNFRNATARDYRFVGDELRFVLELSSTYENSSLSNVGTLAPGAYVVEIGKSGVNFIPLQPANVVIASNTIETPASVPELHPIKIGIDLKNLGNEDAHGIHVAWSSNHNGQTTLISETDIDVLAGEQIRTETTWTPIGSGNWQLQVNVAPSKEGADSLQPATLETTLAVDISPVNMGELLSLDGEMPLGGIPVLVIGLCLVVSAAIVYLFMFRKDDTV